MKYILTSIKLKGKILVEFTEHNILSKLEIDPQDATEKFVRWFLQRLPWHENAMTERTYHTLLKIEPVSDDLSFEAFWDKFGNKVGHKERARKLWDNLSDIDKAKCLASIPRYKAYCASHPHIQVLYPETYLSQKRWENDYCL